MARPVKDTLDYFSLDCDFFNDPDIKFLIKMYPGHGVQLYIYLLCETYRTKGYYLFLDSCFIMVARSELSVSKKKINDIIEFLNDRSLIKKIILPDGRTVLTSDGIQKRYQEICKLRSRDFVVERDIWLLPEHLTREWIVFSDRCDKGDQKCGSADAENEIPISKNEINPAENRIKNSENEIINSEIKTEKSKNEKKIKNQNAKTIDLTESSNSFSEKNHPLIEDESGKTSIRKMKEEAGKKRKSKNERESESKENYCSKDAGDRPSKAKQTVTGKKAVSKKEIIDPNREKAFFDDPSLDFAFREYLRDREEQKIDNTPRAVNLLYTQMKKHDRNLWIPALELATVSHWRSLYFDNLEQKAASRKREMNRRIMDPFEQAMREIDEETDLLMNGESLGDRGFSDYTEVGDDHQ